LQAAKLLMRKDLRRENLSGKRGTCRVSAGGFPSPLRAPSLAGEVMQYVHRQRLAIACLPAGSGSFRPLGGNLSTCRARVQVRGVLQVRVSRGPSAMGSGARPLGPVGPVGLLFHLHRWRLVSCWVDAGTPRWLPKPAGPSPKVEPLGLENRTNWTDWTSPSPRIRPLLATEPSGPSSSSGFPHIEVNRRRWRRHFVEASEAVPGSPGTRTTPGSERQSPLVAPEEALVTGLCAGNDRRARHEESVQGIPSRDRAALQC
jgi:hypothetical protein